MAHSNAVADGYGIEFERRPAGTADRLFDKPSDLVEMDVARHYLAEAVGNSNKRLVDITIAEAAGVKQTPVWCSLKTFLYCITSHNKYSPKTLAKSLENLKMVF